MPTATSALMRRLVGTLVEMRFKAPPLVRGPNLIWLDPLRTSMASIRPATGAKVEAAYGPAREADVPDFQASLERNRERVGYEVSASLDEGLPRTVEWLTERKGVAEESS